MMMNEVNPSIQSSQGFPSRESESSILLQAENPCLDTDSTFSTMADGYTLTSLDETEKAERIETVLEQMTEMFGRYFKPEELARNLSFVDDNERQNIFKDAQCNSELGMRSLLERLVDMGQEPVVEFYRLVTTMDEDSGYLPRTLLSGAGTLKQEDISNLMQFIIELVEQRNLGRLTHADVKQVAESMTKKDLMKKSRASVEKMTPVEGMMQLLTLVRKSNPEWPLHLWNVLQETRPDLFMQELKEDNASSISTQSDQSLESASSSGLTVENPSHSSTETSSVKSSKKKSNKNLRLLHVKPKSIPGADMLIDYGALEPYQVTSEEKVETPSMINAWNSQRDSYLSDEENEDQETELKVPIEGNAGLDVDLNLRKYQKELACAALEGHNTIVCAPTGCGKTRVALDIIIKHLKGNAETMKRTRKVCFFARTVPLANQQYKTICKYLPKDYKMNIFTGESEYSMDMHLLLPELDLVVLTPMILQNHISRGNVEGLAVFSLLVFDECHHAREGETYNTLMASYVDKKVQGKKHLPQVVGLTASFPVEKANNASGAAYSILQLCANLDAHLISVVVENKVELEKTVPVPSEDIQFLQERDNDESFRKIISVMEKLEEEAQDCAQDIGDAGVIATLSKLPSDDRKLQKYNNWTVDLWNKTVELPRSPRETNMSVRLLMIIAQYLTKYHFALETHDLVHLQDVINYLDDCFAENRNDEIQTNGETRFYDYFKVLKDSMKTLCHEDNPNLRHLMKVIDEKLLKSGESSRGIIFVRTRAIAEALVSWLNRCNHREIRNLKASIFTGTNAKESQGGMTQSQQNALVEKFREGKIRLLVATSVAEEGMDVPECNLVIKYNHVGNEITTIQTRGRSRKKGGNSVLLALNKICEKEMLNQKRTELMYKGIEMVRQMDREDFVDQVVRLQITAFEKREIDRLIADEKEKKYKNKKFKMICKLCRQFCIESDDIRLLCGNSRIIVDRDVWDHKKIYPTQPKYINEFQIVGSVRCVSQVEDGTKCNGPLGALLFYSSVYFLAVGIKNFIIEEEGQTKPKAVKRWKDLPYPIHELSNKDIMNYIKPKNKPISGVQETEPAESSHMSSFATTVSQDSSLSSEGLNEIYRRYPQHADASSLSTYSSSVTHHETKRKEFGVSELDSGLDGDLSMDSNSKDPKQ